MKNLPEWQWNEFLQIGTDYQDTAEVMCYENRMLQFRDIAAENTYALDKLQIPKNGKVLEIGCGTGLFARAAAAQCGKVTATDISPAMLQYAAEEAAKQGLTITFKHAGFLTLNEPDHYYDAVMSSLALHHLPDFWKNCAIQNIFRTLKPGGRFFLHDAVFGGHHTDTKTYIQNTVLPDIAESSRTAFIRHIRQEFSTLPWIMRGLLERNGFILLEENPTENTFIRRYLCEKPLSVSSQTSYYKESSCF